MAINLSDLVNFELAEQLSFEPIPAGEYHLTVDACTLGTSRAGNPMYTVDFIVNEGEYTGRSLRYWQMLTLKDRLHFLLPSFCAAATGKDFPEPEGRTADYFESIADLVVGKTATAVVTIRESEDNGEMRKDNQVKKITWDKKTKKKKASTITL